MGRVGGSQVVRVGFRVSDIESYTKWRPIPPTFPGSAGGGVVKGVSQPWASPALADTCRSGMGPLDWDRWIVQAGVWVPGPLTSCCSDKKMFAVKRREQLLALKNLAQLNDVHQQYKILDVMLKGLFKVRVGVGPLPAGPVFDLGTEGWVGVR